MAALQKGFFICDFERMPLIDKKELPELGFPELDAEHAQVVFLMNNLHDASLEDQSSEAIKRRLDELLSFTRSHFHDEEQVMISTGYPAAARHKEQHEELLAKLLAFQETDEAGRPIPTIEMLELLKRWLKVHVASEDIRLVIWYRSRRGSEPAWKMP